MMAENPNIVYVEDFAGSTAQSKIQAAINFAFQNNKKTVIAANKDYYMTGNVIIKQGVKLQGSYGTRFIIGANVRGFELERDASLWNARIMVDYKGYTKEVIYLDGKHKYYNTWHNASLNNIVIINWSGTVSGTGIHLYSGGSGHEISFVNFMDIKIVGFARGLYLKAVKPASGFAYVNANRFDKISLDDCIDNIILEGSETIPNECSGNSFTNLQIQPTPNTKRIMTIQGQINKVDGICWDLEQIQHSDPIFIFKAESNYNYLDMRTIPANRILNSGKSGNRFEPL
ncbi:MULTISPECIES: hypothetical protein [Cytobacillus]|nr:MULTISPECIES: hypothetical protein [Cytobacillus]MCM3529420.1 hypothetical protein [Cytobacillus oceanisediminis]UQX54074.1 hypothetical protein M5V91_26115 [Cytobacillus pseudoceanisediminis]USK43586.1 hypothetical protein LIT27_23880 [Cytobacillus oceanisediminis]